MVHNKWNKKDTDLLLQLYPNIKNCEIAKKLNRTQKSVELKAHRLNLKKSLEFKSNYIAQRNKKIGRDLNYKNLKQIALLYKTRSEFQLMDSSAYTTARKAGLLNKICNHMPIIKFSTPQLILKTILIKLLNSNCLYNNKKIIPPYEIDIYFPEFNLAVEFQGVYWHKNNTKDEIKKNLLIQKKINTLYIYENNRNYEIDIKNQLKTSLAFINDITKKNISEKNINDIKIENVFLNVYNKKQLIQVAKKYNSYKKFIKNEKPVHRKLYKLNLLNKATQHMNDKPKKHSINSIKETVKKYKTLKNFRLNEYGSYLYIKKNNLEHLINHLYSKNKKLNFNIEEIKKIIQKYKTKYSFRTENKQLYNYLKRYKLLHLINNLTNRKKQ